MKTGLTFTNIVFLLMIAGINITYGQLGNFQGELKVYEFKLDCFKDKSTFFSGAQVSRCLPQKLSGSLRSL